MSDFLQKLKSVFIVDESAAPASVTNTPSPTATKQPIFKNNATTSTSPASRQADERFTNVLLSAIEQANFEGFDYFEFKQSLRSLEKMPIDEPTRFRSAFAMAQTMGATKDKLTTTAQQYLNVLAQEAQKFAQAVQNQRAQQVGNKENDIAQLETAIQQKTAQIKQLTEEIAQHQQQTEALKTEIEQATVKVGQTNADFEASYQALFGQIQADVQRIEQYL